MKKLICLLLALLMLLSLAACKPPVDGPDMENPNPPTDNPTNPPDDPGDDPGVPADPEYPGIIDNPEATGADDPLNLIIYQGRYLLEEEEPTEDMTHVLEIYSYGRFMTLEHSLYMEGSLTAFWVEEFWPDTDETFTDIYDPIEGKMQSFSVQTSDTQYDYYPQTTAILYHDSGIAIRRGGSEDLEYFLYDDSQPAPHSDYDTLAAQLQEMDPCTLGEGPLGSWHYWSGEIYTMVNFGQDGRLFWINKILGAPVEIYNGAWGINEANQITILAERLGSGGMPYTTKMNWEYDSDISMLCLVEEAAFFLGAVEGYGYLTAYTPDNDVDIDQTTALTYVVEIWGIQDYYLPDGAEESSYYVYYLPWFLGGSETVEDINEQIRLQFGTMIEQAFWDMEVGNYLECEEVYWEQYRMGDVVAVLIHSYGLYEKHMAFYYNTATDTQVYAWDALQEMGIDEQEYLDSLAVAVEELFEYHHFEMGEDERAESGYAEYRAWTLSADNINLDRAVVADEFGNIFTYVPLETVYGTIWEAVYPFGAAVG